MSSRLLTAALVVGLVSVSVPGCRTASPRDVAEQPNGPIELVVINQNFSDVGVYALAGGLTTRVGTVSGNATATFTLNNAYYGSGDVIIVARPIGGNGRASSGPLAVGPGQTIEFTVGSVLRQSSVMVR